MTENQVGIDCKHVYLKKSVLRVTKHSKHFQTPFQFKESCFLQVASQFEEERCDIGKSKMCNLFGLQQNLIEQLLLNITGV